jgi:transcriptional regulator MftR-like protein
VDEPVLESVRHVVKGRLRAVLVDGTDAERQELLLRTRLLRDVPAVRARVTESLCTTGRLLCTVIAERTGRDAGDLKVRVFAAAVVAALLEATLYWTEHGRRDDPADLADPADLVDLIDDALDVLADRSWDAP